MRYRIHQITPSQQAVTGALDIFVEGCRHGKVHQQLFGLSVLQSATGAAIEAAMPAVQASQSVTAAEIHAMFAL
jgi:hypothetical protein